MARSLKLAIILQQESLAMEFPLQSILTLKEGTNTALFADIGGSGNERIYARASIFGLD